MHSYMLVAPQGGEVKGIDGVTLIVDFILTTTASVLFDAIYVPGGDQSIAALAADGAAGRFVLEAYKHCKPIAASGAGQAWVQKLGLKVDSAMLMAEDKNAGKLGTDLVQAVAQHRLWEREPRIADIPV